MNVVITTDSPERGWPPFLEWLREQGLDPADVRGIAIHNDDSAVAVVIRRRRGRPLVHDGELVTLSQRVDRITRRPPLHPARHDDAQEGTTE